MKVIAGIGDTKRQSRHRRRTEGRPHTHPRIHATHTSNSPSAKHPPYTHRGPRFHPVLAPHRPQTLHSSLTPPLTPHTPRTAHTHLTRPACTLQTPHSPCIHPTHLVDTGSTPHTWRIARTPRPAHTPRTHHRPCSHHAHAPHSPRAHRTLRVRRARSQRSRSLCPKSPSPPRRAAPAGRGGCAALPQPGTRRGELKQQRPRPRTPRDPARAPETSAARPIPVACAARCRRPRDPRPGPCRWPHPPPAAAFLSTHRSPPSSPALLSIGNSQLSPGRRHRLRRGRRRRSEELRRPPLKPRRGGRRDL